MISVRFERTVFDEEGRTLRVLVAADVTPGRAAPACQDPDKAAFHDPGDPAEVTLRSVWWLPGPGATPRVLREEGRDGWGRWAGELERSAFCEATSGCREVDDE